MKINKLQKALVLLTFCSGALALGCELVVDFDRTKIPVDLTEASVPDGAVPDAALPTGDGAADTDAAVDTDAGDSGTPIADASDAG